MKQKERLAEDWFLKNRELNDSGEGTFSMTEAFLAGFESAKKEILDKYFNTPGDHYNKQRTIEPEEIYEIGND